MSDKKIDHAEVAKILLGIQVKDPMEITPARNFAAAQVHATLALVEQQRIANLLALAQFDHNVGHTRLFTDFDFAGKLRGQACAALGFTNAKEANNA